MLDIENFNILLQTNIMLNSVVVRYLCNLWRLVLGSLDSCLNLWYLNQLFYWRSLDLVVLDIHINTSLNMYVSRNIHISSTITSLTSWNVHIDSILLGNVTLNASRLLDLKKLDSAIALLNVDIGANITLIIAVNVYGGSGTLCGDELPLRSWCISVADMVCKNWDDISSNSLRLKVFTTASSQLTFSNISISVIHLDFCNSAAEVPCATNDCHNDKYDDQDDDVSLRIYILFLNVIVSVVVWSRTQVHGHIIVVLVFVGWAFHGFKRIIFDFFICSCLFNEGNFLLSGILVNVSARDACLGLEFVNKNISLTKSTFAFSKTCWNVFGNHFNWFHLKVVNIFHCYASGNNSLNL